MADPVPRGGGAAVVAVVRLRGRVDANQVEIVEYLQAHGATVLSLADLGDGAPDLLVGYRRRDVLVEVKDGAKPPSRRRLTPAEQAWHDAWAGKAPMIWLSVADVERWMSDVRTTASF